MALSYSTDRVDENGKELLSYGSSHFPIAFFDDDLTVVSVPYHWHTGFDIICLLIDLNLGYSRVCTYLRAVKIVQGI